MKWLMLLLCLLLCGCEAEPEVPPISVEPTEEIIEIPTSIADTLEEVEEETVETVQMEVKREPVWHGSEPQQGEPMTPQPGETASTWDLSRAENHPADSECTPLALLEKWMDVEGLAWADLDQRDCDQLVLAVAQDDGVTNLTTCYTRQADGSWAAEPELTAMPGFMGKNGIAHNRRRSSLQSPAGLWALGSAFGLAEEPEGMKLPWRVITDQSDWVTDDRSVYYNTWQERDDPAVAGTWDWNDTEHLADYEKTYTYACVIEFNTPPYVVPDRGCAIFFHVSDHPTEGCVALLTEDMVRTLQWLNPHRNPHILITGGQSSA